MKQDRLEKIWHELRLSESTDPERDAQTLHSLIEAERRLRRQGIWTAVLLPFFLLVLVVTVSMTAWISTEVYIGVGLVGIAMIAMTLFKFLRRIGLERIDHTKPTREFLERAQKKFRYSRLLISYGIILYVVLLGSGFALVFFRRFAGQDARAILLATTLGVTFLVFLAVQGILRARREYREYVQPLKEQIDRMLNELKSGNDNSGEKKR
jgi:Flp pilus assembly protein TadB